MNVLVAGGAGFIGSHLCDGLIAEGHNVTCIDNFFIGTKDNIKHLTGKDHFIFYEKDLSDIEWLKKLFLKESFDYVFHLAANSDIQASAVNPVIEYTNTLTTTFNLLESMRLAKVKKLFFASTSAVYGEKDGVSVSENDTALIPISYYGSAKLSSEAFISSYAYMNGMSALIFRFPNVVGPRLTHGVIFDFIKKLENDKSKLEILGDGKQKKPYIYVMDLIDGILRFKDAASGVSVYNIGVETQTSVSQIADIVCETMGLLNVEYLYTGGKGGWKGDVPVFSYDLSKISQAGWKARYTSNEAVKLTTEECLSCRR